MNFDNFSWELAFWIRSYYKIDEIGVTSIGEGVAIQFKVSRVIVWSFLFDKQGDLLSSTGNDCYRFIEETFFPKGKAN